MNNPNDFFTDKCADLSTENSSTQFAVKTNLIIYVAVLVIAWAWVGTTLFG